MREEEAPPGTEEGKGRAGGRKDHMYRSFKEILTRPPTERNYCFWILFVKNCDHTA